MSALAALLVWLLVAFLVWRAFSRRHGMFEREWLVVAAYWLVVMVGLVLALPVGTFRKTGR